VYDESLYKLNDSAWLVSDNATSEEVSRKIGLSETGGLSGLVMSAGSYFGRASPNLWEWIKNKWDIDDD
jgi:hypothetical protein